MVKGSVWISFAVFCILSGCQCQIPTLVDSIAAIKQLAQIPQQSLLQTLWASAIFNSTATGGNACFDDFKIYLNKFMGDRSIVSLLIDTGKNLNELGDYKSCRDDNGRYFVINVAIVKLGFCAPTACTEADFEPLKKILVELIKKYSPNYSIPMSQIRIVDPHLASKVPVGKGTVITIAIFVLVLVAAAGAALVDQLSLSQDWQDRGRKVVESFNIIKSAQHLLYSVNRVDKNLDILNGTKTLAMGWIMFGHLLMMLTLAPILNISEVPDLFLKRRSYSLYTSANLAVDVFFCLTGFLGVLVVTEQLRNPKQNKLLAVLLIYMHRYVRMLPIYAVTILLVLYIMPILYDGPIYFQTLAMRGDCDTAWYQNLLYYNNFITNKFCCGWTWYIANDFQMYLFVPPLVLLAQASQVLAYVSVLVLMLASFITQIAICIHYNITLNVTQSQNQNGDNNVFSVYYNRPYCRINPFLLGILMAWMYIAHKTKQKPRVVLASPPSSEVESPPEQPQAKAGEEKRVGFVDGINKLIIEHKAFRYPLYVVGLVLMTVFVYAFFDFYKEGTDKSRAEHISFILFSRPGFVFGLFCIVYPGCLGKARVIRAILSIELFNVLSRVVFAAYIPLIRSSVQSTESVTFLIEYFPTIQS